MSWKQKAEAAIGLWKSCRAEKGMRKGKRRCDRGEKWKVSQLVPCFEPLPRAVCSWVLKSCPTRGVQRGGDVRNCTAMGIVEIGRGSVQRRRGGLEQECKQRLYKGLDKLFSSCLFLWLLFKLNSIFLILARPLITCVAPSSPPHPHPDRLWFMKVLI